MFHGQAVGSRAAPATCHTVVTAAMASAFVAPANQLQLAPGGAHRGTDNILSRWVRGGWRLLGKRMGKEQEATGLAQSPSRGTVGDKRARNPGTRPRLWSLLPARPRAEPLPLGLAH